VLEQGVPHDRPLAGCGQVGKVEGVSVLEVEKRRSDKKLYCSEEKVLGVYLFNEFFEQFFGLGLIGADNDFQLMLVHFRGVHIQPRI
jgi:hypothetical protein